MSCRTWMYAGSIAGIGSLLAGLAYLGTWQMDVSLPLLSGLAALLPGFYALLVSVVRAGINKDRYAGIANAICAEESSRTWLASLSVDAPRQWLPLYVGSVIAAAAVLVAAVASLHQQLDLPAIALFALLAATAEIMQVDLYGDGSVSVSVAMVFAVALVAGLPGIAWVSAAIALSAAAVSARRRPIKCYRVAFNWALHVLGGVAPLLAFLYSGVPLTLVDLPRLIVPMGIAALAYFLIESGLLVMAMSLAECQSPAALWSERFRWLAGHYLLLCLMGLFMGLAYGTLGLAGAVIFALPIGAMRYAQKQYVERTRAGNLELRRINEELRRANQEIVIANHSIRQAQDELFITIARIFDARDPYTSGHAAKVAEYATAIAADMQLPAHRITVIWKAALLHDIGKIGVPERILNKAGRLTAEEYEQVKVHATLGAELLETSDSLRSLAPFVRHHHERWDGAGYPDGLRGEQIPLEARILAVCDAVEAMASDRPYKQALPIPMIVAEIARSAGTQFDPAVVASFLRVVEQRGASLIVNSAQQVTQQQQALARAVGHGSPPG